MDADTDFDLDGYLDQCHRAYRYLNQDAVWAPRPPRKPLPIADMDPAWRHNAANFLLRRAEHLAHRYIFGMVRAASVPAWSEVIGEDHGEPAYSGTVFSEFDLMGDHARDAFEDEQHRIIEEPEVWLRTTPLYRALVAGLPTGEERERLAERARHWSTCPARAHTDADCECRVAANPPEPTP
jgi:hypothetical protein